MAKGKRVARKVDTSNQYVVNASKTLLANIRFMGVDHPYHVLAFTSAVPNEGKTFVVANLGNAIATSGKTCLLVEADLRRRSLAAELGVHPQRGLYSVLSSHTPLLQAVVRTTTPNLYFLDAEPHIPSPSDMLNSNRFQRLIADMRTAFDYVIFDTPPVGTFIDAAVLGTKVDAVFLVVRENFVHKDELQNAADQLRASGSNLAGVVMNYCEKSSNSYYYEHYYTEKKGDEGSAPVMVPVAPPAQPAAAAAVATSSAAAPTVPTPPYRPKRPAHEQIPSVTDSAEFERLAVLSRMRRNEPTNKAK